jgi:hypothetical protein
VYNAICMSDEENSQYNFPSYEAAELHVKSQICSSCLEELEAGGINMSDGWYDINSVLGTCCGAEWLIEESE